MRAVDILKDHYKSWADTTNNPVHREYATTMYNAVLNGNYKEVYSELGSTAVRLYDPNRDVLYQSIGDAAKAYKVSPSSMGINYARYGLIKKKL